MESVSDSLLRAVCPSLLLHELAKVATSCTYYLYFWGQKDWRFCKFFIFFLSCCSQHHYYIIVLFVVKHFFTILWSFFVIFWKKFEKVFKLELWKIFKAEVSRKMLNRNRYRFYNEVISLILLFPQEKHQTLQWVCQCFSMFSIEGMWAIDLQRLVCMLLLSFEYHGWDLNPYAPKSNGF